MLEMPGRGRGAEIMLSGFFSSSGYLSISSRSRSVYLSNLFSW